MARKPVKKPATIKLNLMPPYIAAARMTRVAAVVTVIVCLLILGGMGLWWQSNAAEIARLNETLQQKTREADEVTALESQAQQKRQEVSDISNALKVLDDIRKSGDEWANIMQKIAAWIPEGVKLTELTFQGSPTEAQAVRLVGYTTSVMKLRDFYSQLSQSALFSSVSLQAVDKNGVPIPVAGLPPVLPKEKPKPEVGAELEPQEGQQGQPGPAPGAPMPSGGPGMGMHGAPSGGPGMGMHGAPSGGPGMGMHGAPSGGPGMGMHGGPTGGPPAMGPGAPMMGGMMGMAPMMGAMPMMGAGQQQQIIRDPTAPRNAVYFVILATLAKPVQVATSLRPPQPAAGMMGAMGGMAPAGGLPPGAMPEEALLGPEAAGAGAPPSGPAAPPGEGAGGIGGRRGIGGMEE
ncbi:PilN domain-containing protein [Fervidibacter sp.]|jgi:Tfp pilus assembly protein PilN